MYHTPLQIARFQPPTRTPKEVQKHTNAFRTNGKEKSFIQEFHAVAFLSGKEEFKNPVTVRVYHRPSGKYYARVWVDFDTELYVGSGNSNHSKMSSAVDLAFKDAGVELSLPIHGQDQFAVEAAVLAVARHIYPDVPLYVNHQHA